MRRRPLAALFGGLVAFSLVLGAALPAQAALTPEERASALWYADRLKFDEIRELGLTGKGVTIAVVDDAINLDAPELAGADIEVRGQFCKNRETGDELPATTDDPERAHGTNVVAMLVGNGTAADGGPGTRGIVPEAKILFYASDGVTKPNGEWDCEAYNPVTGEYEKDREIQSYTANDPANKTGFPSALAVSQAVADGADIVSLSSVSSVWNMVSWFPATVGALRAGVPLVAGTANPDGVATSLDIVPASMNGTIAVQGVDNDGNIIRGTDHYGETDVTTLGLSNMGFAGPGFMMLTPSGDDAWEPGFGSGTSLATPLVAGTIALGLERYPEASANQVLQAMTRTTGKGEVTEPRWVDEHYGYGIINPLAMLQVDPTRFPDENPLFVRRDDDPRCGSGATSEPTSNLETCLWASGPSLEQVWPEEAGNGEGGSDAERNEAGDAGVRLMSALLIGGGALVLLVIAAAVIVPVTVSRANRRRAASAAEDWNTTEGTR